MSKYTTGEIAKICDVTVRTVQYYDQRSILIPSELTEGGRRLYTDDDVNKLRMICFLRDLGLSINCIADIFQDDNSKDVLSMLIEEHEQKLKEELKVCEDKLHSIRMIKDGIKDTDDFSINILGDIAHIMKTKDKMKTVRRNMVIYAVASIAIEIATVALWITMGLWVPFAISYAVVAAVGIFWLIPYYYKRINFICPHCHEEFKPKFWEFFFAGHTPKTRKLTCTKCGEKHWCVETYDESSEKE